MADITFIGAGSVVFAKNLMTDIFSFERLRDSTITLMDIDPQRLDRAAEIGEAIVDSHDLPGEIRATTDRREALEGTDYVFNMINVGGEAPFENEIRIPEEYGVKQAVGDTLGPGGVFRALRTAPTVLDIARDMEELCPDALLLNYTNPMAILCWAVDEATDIDVVGLCHSVQHTTAAIGRYLDVPSEELQHWVAGINHMAWYLELEHDGQDCYPALRDAADDPDVYAQDPVRFDVMDHFGAFITESSHHLSEYLPYFRTDQDVIDDLTPEEDFGHYTIEWMPTGRYLEHWRSYQPDLEGEVEITEDDVSLERSPEYGSRIVHSIETDEVRRMNLNVRNDTGAISNLPDDSCVEVPCLIDGRGIHPCSVGDLPSQLAALNRTNIGVQERAVTAILEQDETALRQAVKLDPLTAAELDLETIDEMVDDLLAVNAEYLPELD
ncbi:glycoside hydrolase family 4 (plasmid) [Haloterrigena turkmenica DSM 5511]|uniref:Glycoside hydrolase family 4 n=1 Tax=Haloterrigena turkmenica (strain ATCC 51198 / DSM 5511 / JCM 9101 / NCIMB 13204 / VKM B-1734 / 4k) TaxID=543526 RepID=D2S1P8_HALTV|nr:alpha-galactosidase [Haloterrigena turkmenica]ADB63295.1 glycoside hydrolase family 4 [Haloterrigena turkmenica DSM 5511]